ncbi:MAG: DNA-directed RNA polymerase subunit beta', partial [Clostridia bacterium]|nr:DNA-directed RNA polymerase subunit beta' [Clostridia bacterium]
ALELFKPFIMKKLVDDGLANNIKSAKKMVERAKTEVWDALEEIISEHPVLLNRAPTLHRLGIQAFEPILVEGRALKLHPLVCTAYNADFDGDQMAVHLPLSAEAQAEARVLMLSANNLLKPVDGKPIAVPTQDMILGSYYLTVEREDEPGAGKVFMNVEEAQLAYDQRLIGIHAPIRVRLTREVNGEMISRIVPATMGQLIFNSKIPQDLGFVDRTDPEHVLDLEVTFPAGKKKLGAIIAKCIEHHGFVTTAEVLDEIKSMGFKYSTRGALTIAVADMVMPSEKPIYIAEAEKRVADIERKFKRGFITNEERRRLVIDEWDATTKRVTDALQSIMTKTNPIYMMSDSGARGSMAQIRQLAGMRGLVADTSGRTIEIPIKSNFREGLSVLEFFISSRSARKGQADTALRTADSGYLTRRLVDVSQEVIVREEDCGETEGIEVHAIMQGNQLIEPFNDRLVGRYLVRDLIDEKTGELLQSKDKLISERDAKRIIDAGITSVRIRSPLTCNARHGVCSKCYGVNLATSETVSIGEAVGIIAAQSIGEPGTQLTMRTFHSGGIAGGDITQGLPRVEELFESRKPKRVATLAEISGTVNIEEIRRGTMRNVIVTNPVTNETRAYPIPAGLTLKVSEGDAILQGQELTEGALNPHDVLRVRGVSAVHDYLIQEVQKVYRQQGVDINDKHIEVIVRQMMRKVKIEDAGDTDLMPGAMVDIFEYRDANAAIEARIQAGEAGLVPATYTPVILGITRASLATDSFLSAASFQETTKVLTEAAIKGKVDHLRGLKENVIIGKLIPAGTGLSCYRAIDVEPAGYAEPIEETDTPVAGS